MDGILTDKQKLALELIAKSNLADHFYFTGGTALAHFYLQHRFSEDLDFFNTDEFDPQQITAILKKIQKELGFTKFDYQNSFNRNLYFLHFKDKYILKLEFTYFPFPQVEKIKKKDGLLVDSPLDIAINKVFTIAQKPRGRDYFDLYFLIEKYGYKIEELRQKAKIKFDWHVDPLQLASRLFDMGDFLDDPILSKSLSKNKIVKFFQNEAEKLNEEIIKV